MGLIKNKSIGINTVIPDLLYNLRHKRQGGGEKVGGARRGKIKGWETLFLRIKKSVLLFSQVWSPVVIRHSYGSHGCWKPCRTNNKPDLRGPISLWSSHVKPFMKSLWMEAITDRAVPEELLCLQWISSSLSSQACTCDKKPCPETVHTGYLGIENWHCVLVETNYNC